MAVSNIDRVGIAQLRFSSSTYLDLFGQSLLIGNQSSYTDRIGISALYIQSVQLYAKVDQVGVYLMIGDPPKTLAYPDKLGANMLFASPMAPRLKPYFQVRQY